jgi:hypothetical protein
MSRALLWPALTLLAACGAAEHRASAPAEEGVDCALDGSDAFMPCAVAREPGAQGAVFTIAGETGGFRRIRLGPGGRIEAADGAEPARTTALGDGRIEIAIGRDRFRLRRAVLR